jgi:asparagine synthetase B (glutamine-hydrolysing)
MSFCGVIARSMSVPEQTLRNWYREAFSSAPTPSYVNGRVALASPRCIREGEAMIASRHVPIFWTSNGGYGPNWSPQSFRADDDCTVVITPEQVSLRSTSSGASIMFFHITPDYVVFSTSIGQLTCARSATLDSLGVGEVLRFGAGYTQRTILEGIERIPFAHQLILDTNGAARVSPFQFFNRTPNSLLDGTDAQQQIHSALTNALAQIPEEPTLLFSGGVDSTLIAQLLKASDRPFRACMLEFGPNDHELDHARQTAKLLDMPLDYASLSIDFEDILHCVSAYAIPTLDFSILPTYALGQKALNTAGIETTRLLDGTGGDAWFGFSSLQHATIWRHLSALAPLRGAAQSAFSYLAQYDGNRFLWPLKVLGRIPGRHAAGLGHMCATPLYSHLLRLDANDWLRIEDDILNVWRDLTNHQPQDDLSQVLVMDAVFIATSQFAAKTCQWNLASHSGTFYPFLMPHMVEIARQIPSNLLISQGQAKPLLKNLMVSLGLPSNFAFRAKKGFQPPLQHILARPEVRKPLLAVIENDTEVRHLFSEYAQALPRKLLDSGRQLTIQTLYTIWGLTVITLWVQSLRRGELKH